MEKQEVRPFINREIILKVVTKCTNMCRYCHWYRDDSVLGIDPILSEELEKTFFQRLANHVRKYHWKDCKIIFHGGEPLLFGKNRYISFVRRADSFFEKTGCKIHFAMNTNATILDHAWAKLLKDLKINVSISLDGPPHIHDKNRLSLGGKGTYQKVLSGINALRNENFERIGFLSVCDPDLNPDEIVSHFFNDLAIKNFDLLIPNFDYKDKKAGHTKSVYSFYKRLFDIWYDEYSQKGLTIRSIEGWAKVLLNRQSNLSSIGYGPMAFLTVKSDGGMEPHDVLRINGKEQVYTGLNIKDNEFEDLFCNEVWMNAFNSSINLPSKCQKCPYELSCGGGYLPHRYSDDKGYDNPSIYCDDIKSIYKHIWKRISADLMVVNTDTSTN